MGKFEVRGLEIHSSRMWQQAAVDKVLDLMEQTNLNTLIFHQNDLIDKLVFPNKYFSDDLMWKRWPVRMHSIYNNRYYINRIIKRAKEKGIRFFVEVKEIWYPEELLELVPELRTRDGHICPTNPFWWDFLKDKLSELLEVIPDIAGVIVSPGTRESKVSISTNTCKCQRCKQYDPAEWYYHLIKTMYEVLSEKNKTLVIRDFAYTADQQDLILQAASRCSNDIIIALKNTPHDYYPTFPNNPKIGHTGDNPQWIEFDTWGQFFGLGFFPVSVVEDMQNRMNYCYEKGASGIWLRTDWEVITEASVFNSLNIVNLIGGALISQDTNINLDEVYKKWVNNYGLLSPLKSNTYIQKPIIPQNDQAWKKLMEFMKKSWSVMEKTVYVRGHLFCEDCEFPDTVQKAFAMMVEIHGRDDWEPGASKRLTPTDENLKIIFEEKEQAESEVKSLSFILDNIDSLGLPEEYVKELGKILHLYTLYVQGFKLCAYACFLAKKAISSQCEKDFHAVEESLDDLISYRDNLIDQLKNTNYPHYVYWLLSEERLEKIINDIKSILKNRGI